MLARFYATLPAAKQSRFLLTPFHLLVFYLASWIIHRKQFKIIAYLQMEKPAAVAKPGRMPWASKLLTLANLV